VSSTATEGQPDELSTEDTDAWPAGVPRRRPLGRFWLVPLLAATAAGGWLIGRLGSHAPAPPVGPGATVREAAEELTPAPRSAASHAVVSQPPSAPAAPDKGAEPRHAPSAVPAPPPAPRATFAAYSSSTETVITTSRPAEASPGEAAERQAVRPKSPAVTSPEDDDVAEIVVVEERMVLVDENGEPMGELSRPAPKE